MYYSPNGFPLWVLVDLGLGDDDGAGAAELVLVVDLDEASAVPCVRVPPAAPVVLVLPLLVVALSVGSSNECEGHLKALVERDVESRLDEFLDQVNDLDRAETTRKN